MDAGTSSPASPVLRLLPATEATLLWELSGGPRPAALTGVTVPATWPPADYGPAAIREFLAMSGEPGKLYLFYWIATGGPDDNTLVGSGGFILAETGDYELGYGVAEACRNKGYGTAGVAAMMTWLRNAAGYRGRVTATTQATNAASVRLLEKNGFTRINPTADTDLIGFECR